MLTTFHYTYQSPSNLSKKSPKSVSDADNTYHVACLKYCSIIMIIYFVWRNNINDTENFYGAEILR